MTRSKPSKHANDVWMGKDVAQEPLQGLNRLHVTYLCSPSVNLHADVTANVLADVSLVIGGSRRRACT